jgi:hypothetical protein
MSFSMGKCTDLLVAQRRRERVWFQTMLTGKSVDELKVAPKNARDND